MRVSPPRFTPTAMGAPRPPAGTPGADAHRQTGFVLGEEVDIAGLKRAIEAPLPVAGELAEPEGDQIPLFEEPPAESGDGEGGAEPSGESG